MSTKTGTILVIGLGHCWGGQANVSATHSDAHAPQIYTRLFWCMVVCETRCHQIHSTFPRGLPLLLVDRRMDFCFFFGYFLAVEKKLWSVRRWTPDTTGDMAGFQELSRIFAINRAAQAGSCDAFLTFPDCVFSEHTRVLSRLTSIYAEYGILLSTGIILSQSFVATVACWRCWSLQVSLHGSMIQDLSNQVLLWFPDFTYFISYHFEAVWCFWLVVV